MNNNGIARTKSLGTQTNDGVVSKEIVLIALGNKCPGDNAIDGDKDAKDFIKFMIKHIVSVAGRP